MILGNAALEAALAQSHNPSARAEVWHGQRRVGRGSIPIGGGDLSLASSSLARRTGTMEVPNTRDVQERLVPGACLRVWRGVQGVGELPVIWGIIGAPRRSGATIELPLVDLASRRGRKGFQTPRTSIRGATIAAQIQSLWREAVPFITGFIDLSQDVTAMPTVTWEPHDSPSDVLLELAAALGCETFIRPDGNVVLRPVATTRTRPAWVVHDRIKVEADVTADYADVANDVVAIGEHPSGATYFGRYVDEDSPTGTRALGAQTARIESSALMSNAQCWLAAYAEVARSAGAQVSVDYGSVWHPGVETGDVHQVWVSRKERRNIIVDTISVPDVLGAGMTASGREARLTDGIRVPAEVESS